MTRAIPTRRCRGLRYCPHLIPITPGDRRSRGTLSRRRIGVIRESMVNPRGSKTEEPIVTAAATEIKAVLGEHLGSDAGRIVRSALADPIQTSSR